MAHPLQNIPVVTVLAVLKSNLCVGIILGLAFHPPSPLKSPITPFHILD
jgi:hypothetical protein